MRTILIPILIAIVITCTSFLFGLGGEKGALKSNNEIYKGPIIDVHIHAFGPGNNMFGMNYINPLTGKSYVSVNSAEEQKSETFAIFKKYNIVKAVVSNGNIWYDSDPERIIIGESHYNSIDKLRTLHKEGKLHVIGEVAPNYQGLLPTDTSLTKYFDLAEELSIPIAFHMFPGGPPGRAYFES